MKSQKISGQVGCHIACRADTSWCFLQTPQHHVILRYSQAADRRFLAAYLQAAYLSASRILRQVHSGLVQLDRLRYIPAAVSHFPHRRFPYIPAESDGFHRLFRYLILRELRCRNQTSPDIAHTLPNHLRSDRQPIAAVTHRHRFA